MERDVSSKNVIPRVASFPGSTGKTRQRVATGKDSNFANMARPHHKSFPGSNRNHTPPCQIPGTSGRGMSSSTQSSPISTGSDDLNTDSPSSCCRQPTGDTTKITRRSKRSGNLVQLQSDRLASYCTTGPVDHDQLLLLKPVGGGSSLDPQDDNYDDWSWKEYGRKLTPKSSSSRGFYRCGVNGCPAKKVVRTSSKGDAILEVTYVDSHTCVSRPQKRQRDDASVPEVQEYISMGAEGPALDSGEEEDEEVMEDDEEVLNPTLHVQLLQHMPKFSDRHRKTNRADRAAIMVTGGDLAEFDRCGGEETSLVHDEKKVESSVDDEEGLGGDTQEWGYSQEQTSQEWQLPRSQYSQEWPFSQELTMDEGYTGLRRQLGDLGDLTQNPDNTTHTDRHPTCKVPPDFSHQQAEKGCQSESAPTTMEEQAENGLERFSMVVAGSARNSKGKSGHASPDGVWTASQCDEMDDNYRVAGVLSTGKNLQQLHLVQIPGEITVAGRELDSLQHTLEFYFLDAKSMSRVIGVGLDHAKVILKSRSELEVVACDEKEWKDMWAFVLKEGSAFEVMTVKLPEVQVPPERCVHEAIGDTEMAQKFGVGLQGTNRIVVHDMESDNESLELELLLWEVARFLLAKTSICGRQHASNESGRRGNQGQEGYGGTNAKDSLPNMYGLRIGENQGGNGDEDEESSRGPLGKPSGAGSGAEHDNALLLRVTVRPGRGGTFSNQQYGVRLPPSLSKVSKIYPTLTFDFTKRGTMRSFTVKTIAECALGDGSPKETDKERFGWYQDHIQVSLKCIEDDSAILETYNMLDMGEDVKANLTNSHAHTTGSNMQAGMAVQFAIPLMGGLSIQGSSDTALATQGTYTTQEAYEISRKQVSNGFFYRDNSSMGDARLAYEFLFSHEVREDVWKPSEYRRLVAQSGICATLKPILEGTWEPLTEDEHTPYLFQIERRLIEKRKNSHSMMVGELYSGKAKVHESLKHEVIQEYIVPLYVNHAMTHLDRVGGGQKLMNEKVKEIPKVMILGQKLI